MANNLRLKWGTVKGWDFETTECEVFKKLQEYMSGSHSVGCAQDRPDDGRKKLLCSIIDQIDGEIQNDWSGEIMTKEVAKDYVMNYGS